MADKPENHLAIAAYYRTLAGDALAEAEKHKAMRNTYRHDHQKFKSGAATGQSMARHCDRLTKLQEETAAEYEALAKLHEAEAAGFLARTAQLLLAPLINLAPIHEA